MAEPKTTNLGLNLSHPTSPDVRGEWPASMDENLQKIDAFAGSGGGGGVTNTGDLTGPFILIGNDGAEIKADTVWKIVTGEDESVLGTDEEAGNDNAYFAAVSADGTQFINIGIQGAAAFLNISKGDPATGAFFQVSPDGGVVGIVGIDLDLSDGGTGNAHLANIIDSTGSPGTAGQILSSLGSGLGVKWIDPA